MSLDINKILDNIEKTKEINWLEANGTNRHRTTHTKRLMSSMRTTGGEKVKKNLPIGNKKRTITSEVTCPECDSKPTRRAGGRYDCEKDSCNVYSFRLDNWGNIKKITYATIGKEEE